MTITTTPTTQFEQRYRQEYWSEYVRDSGFMADMAASPMAIIHTAMEALGKGQTINYPMLTRLKNSGRYGADLLVGNEEALNKHKFALPVEFRRHAVVLDRRDEQFDFGKARDRVAPMLKEWSMNQLRYNVIDALSMVAPGLTFTTPLVPGDGTVTMNAAATSTQNNTWATQNGDWTNAAGYKSAARILFGNARANTAYLGASVIFATSLANVTSSMKLSAGMVSAMKRIAKLTDPHIRPIRVGEQGREYFKMYAGSYAFRDLKTDPTILLANESARAREGDGMMRNPIFQDGDIDWDGVIVKEVPEIPVLAGAGASGIDVAPVFLCGAQAVAVGWGQYPRFTTRKEDDYDFLTGIGIEEALGVAKFQRNLSQTYDNGVVTGFVSGASDA